MINIDNHSYNAGGFGDNSAALGHKRGGAEGQANGGRDRPAVVVDRLVVLMDRPVVGLERLGMMSERLGLVSEQLG